MQSVRVCDVLLSGSVMLAYHHHTENFSGPFLTFLAQNFANENHLSLGFWLLEMSIDNFEATFFFKVT